MEKNHELLRELLARKLHTAIAALCGDATFTLKQKKMQNTFLIRDWCACIKPSIFKYVKYTGRTRNTLDIETYCIVPYIGMYWTLHSITTKALKNTSMLNRKFA